MTDFDIDVEFEIDGVWTSVARLDADTRVLTPIQGTWGRTKPQERMAPALFTFSMLDNNCLFDEDNYASAYFRKVEVGTPARISVDGDYRITGRIASMKRVPGETPDKSTVNVEVAGPLRALDIAQRPIASAAYEAFSAPENDSTRIFYAPLEDEANTTKIATFDNLGSVAVDSPVTLGGDTDSLSSARLVTFGTEGKLEIEVPFYSSTEHKVCMLWKFPEGGLTNGYVPVRLHTVGGNIDRIHLRFNTPWAMILDAMRGFSIVDSAVSVDWTGYIDNHQEFYLSIELTQNGANIDCLVGIIREDGVFGIPTDTLVGCTLGRIFHITIGANDISGSSFGHLIVGNDTGAFGNYIRHTSNVANGVNGYTSEYADLRMYRLLSSQGLIFGVSQATVDDTAALGPQEPKTVGDLIYEAVDTDGGFLYEHRPYEALVYQSRFATYNMAPTKSFTWAHLTPPLAPSGDDQELYNDVTANRAGGSSARYVIPDGDWWHRAPDSPAGNRPGSADVTLENDDDLTNHAAWRAHVLSWREKRFDQITMNLGRSVFTSTTRANARFLQAGDMLALDTSAAPPYVRYKEMRFMIQGGTETIHQKDHQITFNTTPYDVFEVTQVDAEGSVLAAPITSGTTSIKIAPPTKGPEWADDGEDLPYHISVDGQPMTVTAMTTDTPAFIAASATVASANNGPVTPALPAGITADVGQLLLIWATIRNSGTGTPDEESGWETLVSFGNTKLYGRYYRTGDTAPQITFTGGVANADCLARMFAFSGLSMKFASGTKGTPDAHTQLNGSAANIAYPAFTLNRDGSVSLIFLWKQDDFTTLSTPSGYTSMSADASTTGDDAGIGAYYDLTAVAGAAGTITVTGGAAAISRAVVLALRPLQTATVTRGIYGTAAAASVGAEVHSWRMGVNGL